VAAERAHHAVHRAGTAERVEQDVGRHVVAHDHHQRGAVGQGRREARVEEAQDAAPLAGRLVRGGQPDPLTGVEAAVGGGGGRVRQQDEQLRGAPGRERLVDVADHHLLHCVQATCVDGGHTLDVLDEAPDDLHRSTIRTAAAMLPP
jgi:hypothetical protein